MWLLGTKSQSFIRVLLATESSLQALENAKAFVLTTVLLTQPNDSSAVGRCSGFILVTVVKCPDHNNAERRRVCFSLRFQATYRPSQLGRHRGRDLKIAPISRSHHLHGQEQRDNKDVLARFQQDFSSLILLGISAWRMVLPTIGRVFPYQLTIKTTTPTPDMPTSQSDLENSLARLSSQVIIGYIKLKLPRKV